MFVNTHTHLVRNEGLEVINASHLEDNFAYHSYGIHPWNATEAVSRELFISAKQGQENFIALGEIGLDKQHGPPFSTQLCCFKAQLEIAEYLGVPVIIHCVNAWNELRVLKREMNPSQQWIYHGFNKAVLLDEIVSEGLVVSVGEAIFTNKKLQNALIGLPLAHLLLETDTSHCSIYRVYEKLSQLKNIPLAAIEKQLEENFKRIFKHGKLA